MDLRDLNLYIPHKKFRVLTLDSILPLLSQGNWFITIDLQDAYFHISIHLSHQKFLQFRFHHATYQFTALPFRLSTAPRTFTKCMAPVVACLHAKGIKIFPYIDDWLLVAKAYQEAVSATNFTLYTLKRLVLKINKKKSSLMPSQTTSYIGATLDSIHMRAFLPSQRIRKIQAAAFKFTPYATLTVHDTLHLLGLMVYTTSVVLFTRLKLRPLQSWFLTQYDPMMDPPTKKLRVPPLVAKHLIWWTMTNNLSLGRLFHPPYPSIQVMTDASPSGWGAHCQELRVHSLWTLHQRTIDINQLELLAVIKAFQAFLPCIQGRVIQLVTDNTTVMHYNRQGRTRFRPLL